MWPLKQNDHNLQGQLCSPGITPNVNFSSKVRKITQQLQYFLARHIYNIACPKSLPENIIVTRLMQTELLILI